MDAVVVITGASGGIGAALARLVAARGASVALVARRADALHAVAADCDALSKSTGGQGALALVADVTRRDDVKRAVEETLGRFGRIDVWINNAGQGLTRMPSELTDADVDQMMRVNVKSVLYGMQEVLPHFRARGAGHIINVSSMLGRIPFAVFRSAYSAAKHYLNALTAMFRAELAEAYPGIQVSLVSPGVVHTEFGLNALHGGPDSRTLPGGQSPEEVAAVLLDVIETRKPDVYTFRGARAQVASYYGSTGTDYGSDQ